MDERLYRFLKYTAIALVVLWIGWSLYDGLLKPGNPGDAAYLSGNTLFEDESYERALAQYGQALADAPDHIHALRGYARTLMQLGRHQEAQQAFDQAIASQPEFGGTYANRGILHDRMGNYELAIEDYEQALALDAEIADGPHWLTRFLRLQPQKPPGVAERAQYLRAELAKPETERVLRMPEIDSQQRPYQQ